MARSQAGAAAVHFRRIGDERHEASCLVILASIDRRVGKRRLARRRLRVARGKARSSNDPLTEAVALMNLALVELDLGRHENALAGTEAALAIDSEQVTPVTPVLQAIEARALAGLGRVDGARERLNRSIAGNKPGSGRAHLAAWWNAEVLAEIGDGSAAAEQVALAHQLLVRNLDGLPDLAARRAWDVPEHRAIADARERYFVDQVSWRVPGREAPTGRPLDSEELIDIVWTISHPDDWAVPASAARRRLRIQRLATEAWDQGGVARVADVAAALDVSERTIKRDLAQLRADGYSPPTRRGPGES
jgi:tetratricopeptide (TPR) repeat protein